MVQIITSSSIYIKLLRRSWAGFNFMMCGFLFLIIFSTSLSAHAAEGMKQLRFAALEDSGPHEVAKLVLRDAYARLNTEVEFVNMPGQRSLHTSNSGGLDGEVGRIAGMSDKYQNLIQIPVPISLLQGVFIGRKSVKISGSRDTLTGYRLAAFNGSKFVERHTRDMNVHYAPSLKNLFQMLRFDRVDLIILPKLSALKYMATHNLTDFHILPVPLVERDIFHYLHLEHVSKVKDLTRILEEMKADGTIDRHMQNVITSLRVNYPLYHKTN